MPWRLLLADLALVSAYAPRTPAVALVRPRYSTPIVPFPSAPRRPATAIHAQPADRPHRSSVATGRSSVATRAGRFGDLFTAYSPLLCVVAALVSVRFPARFAPLGSLGAMQRALAALMLAMGLTLTPGAFARAAAAAPAPLALNAACCFGLMPALALGVSAALACDASARAGVVLLGAVSGGQASNLFALMAGGDAALSVLLTVSTTLLGVGFTPLIVELLLGSTVAARCRPRPRARARSRVRAPVDIAS